MIHVDHEDPVETVLGQARIVAPAKADGHVVEPLALDAGAQAAEHFSVNILGEHAPALSDAFGQANCVIALARPDIGDGRALPDIGQIHNQLRFAKFVAAKFGPGRIARDFGHGPMRSRKIARGLRPLRVRIDTLAARQCKDGYRRDQQGKQTPHALPLASFSPWGKARHWSEITASVISSLPVSRPSPSPASARTRIGPMSAKT